MREGAQRGAGKIDDLEQQKRQAVDFLASIPTEVWLNRQVMIAVTAIMLLAEAYGFDTAPMEGFDPDKIKHEFGIPHNGRVIALLAIGHGQQPDKSYPGRFGLKDRVFRETYGVSWS